MGRRSFAKIIGNRDLSGRIKKGDEIPRPWNPFALFGREAPIELEIGCGKGMFLASAAAAEPSRDFIGVEVAYRYALMAAAGLVKANLTNGLVLCADAAPLLADWIPSASLAAIHIYFPDPWWKKSHRKRRIVRADVVRLIEDRLLPGGRLWLRTDVEEYFRESLGILASETRLLGPEPDPRLPADPKAAAEGDRFRSGEKENLPYYGENGNQNPPVPRAGRGDFLTHFERRTRLNGLPVWGAVFQKRAGGVAEK